MQFWSGTAFLNTAGALAVARMLDETGYDGMICADHLIYPRNLTSPYPTAADAPPGAPETAWPDSWVMMSADRRTNRPAVRMPA
jgi:alkanesulfonate monooxygenase SsuD/methylene tetrahydromethanopterin reductase-like flavin-dependent oxidoreductase (luciferase family)